ncbi:hypothetical protein F441_09228 [Phytophthora nicotianae CJ01A1]|uniref:Uncharacterized protein n=2 Tax=Phytophthora nicotianae TaxID=4792 RepID=W2GTT3_PHYNI|nr:hypothetical protein L915_09089 [Phytophthora nicotianae]ETL39696.1 hypothetical protein L916_09002 [Phytophthora nicotianae]ETP16144.1 hypothetical protein F441_09228 [Phytophthora nicotianae CJ01A1]
MVMQLVTSNLAAAKVTAERTKLKPRRRRVHRNSGGAVSLYVVDDSRIEDMRSLALRAKWNRDEMRY